ncbi:MAG: gliding motility protein GldL, partial [Chitinophagaceae bacterium]
MAVVIPSKVSRIVDIFVSVAAAVVIWGALQKLLHTQYADLFLKIGLGTEALVFLVYGFLYLYFPTVDDHVPNVGGGMATNLVTGNPALEAMDKMLQ